jgi:hypothetical protein
VSTKLTSATSVQSCASLTHLAFKLVMTGQTRSFGFAVIVGENEADKK